MSKFFFAILLFLPSLCYGYSKNDLDCLSLNIYYEARFEQIIGQYATGFVTLNRSRYWHKTICHVVFAKNQFSWVKTLHVLNKQHHFKEKFWPSQRDKLWKKAREVARNILDKPNADFTRNSEFFLARRIYPQCLLRSCRWIKHFKLVGEFGTQLFFRKQDIYHIYGD